MILVAEIGSCWHPEDPGTIVDAARAAIKCGADLVKLQVYDAKELAARRGCSPEKLEPWALPADRFRPLARILEDEGISFGVSVFGPRSLGAVYNNVRRLAFLKTATHEYQWAKLAELVSEAAMGLTELFVSVPPDATCVVGNYSSHRPITWLYCIPYYPAWHGNYNKLTIGKMLDTFKGHRVGISDHTKDDDLLRDMSLAFGPNIQVWEKHFLYDESLWQKTPDASHWSMGQEMFTAFAKLIRQVEADVGKEADGDAV